MEIGAKVQIIKNAITFCESFLLYEIGVVIKQEHGRRGGIDGNWYRVKFNRAKYAVPYWCFETELRSMKG